MRRDTGLLIGFASALVLLHLATNGQYGFMRDELATLADARHLAAGYVAYPPMTPFFGRLSLELFGISLRGIRLFPSIAIGISTVLTALMAREMGGGRLAFWIAAICTAVSPVALASGALLEYVSFDFLCWVLVAYFLVRLLRSGDPRWWMAIGASAGLGMLAKYSMPFLVVGILAGILLTPERRQLVSRWFWIGTAVAFLVFLPNIIWQIQHHFIYLDFIRSIHARDVREGRANGFLLQQLFIAANPASVPFWIGGLVVLLRSSQLKSCRTLGWAYLIVMALFVAGRARGYYSAPLYPMLFAAGAVGFERWVSTLPPLRKRLLRDYALASLALGGLLIGAFTLPLAPVNSRWWRIVNRIDGDYAEEIGWRELVAEVASIRDRLPATDRAHLGILGTNYGEAGAIDLFGPDYHLPPAFSGINSFWYRGYPDPPPQTVIVLGLAPEHMNRIWGSCEVAGHVTNRYGVANEEATHHPDIYVCRDMRIPWAGLWPHFQYFG